MGELEALLNSLMTLLGKAPGAIFGTPPVAGPAAPGSYAGSQPQPGQPGGPGTPGGLNLSTILSLLTGLGGAYYGSNELQQIKRVYDAQRQAEALAMNPEALARRTAAATLPINKQLAYTVDQAADAGVAGRGMFQSPGAVAAARTEALAPYAERNLEMGKDLATFGFAGVENQQAPDYLSVLKQLTQLGQGTAFAGSGSPYSLPAGTTFTVGGTP